MEYVGVWKCVTHIWWCICKKRINVFSMGKYLYLILFKEGAIQFKVFKINIKWHPKINFWPYSKTFFDKCHSILLARSSNLSNCVNQIFPYYNNGACTFLFSPTRMPLCTSPSLTITPSPWNLHFIFQVRYSELLPREVTENPWDMNTSDSESKGSFFNALRTNDCVHISGVFT